LIAQGRFRQDLYDCLRVIEIRVPPLRERPEDIPLLASHFLRKYCQQTRRDLMGEGLCAAYQQAEAVGCATAEFYEALQNYHWPGNVRELENLIRRLLAFVPDEVLDVKHLPKEILKGSNRANEVLASAGEDLTLAGVDRRHIERVLALTGNNQTQTAKMLGIPLSTLRNKMKKLGIKVPKA
jgi:two-component system response regulator HydG